MAWLFVLILPKAAFAAETKSRSFLPALTLPPLRQLSSLHLSATSAAPKELKLFGFLSLTARKSAVGRALPTPDYDDRRKNCGKYCAPTFEMGKTSVAARSILFGVGAMSIGVGAAFALAPSREEKSPFASSFRFCIGTQKLTATAVWSF